jgi:SAM-dependent methyltransferase
MSEVVGGANAEQAAFWQDRAPSWIESEQFTDVVSAGFGLAAIDALSPVPGERVLDIGCGSGPTTVELARRVGPDGSVVGVDIAPAMVEAARRRADGERLGNVEVRTADAQVDDLGDAAFDAAYSRFGVMFFSDPPVAFASVRRALRPGGRLAFVCWQALPSNEWMSVPAATVVRVTGTMPPLPEPGAPGPFSMAEEGRARAILEAAGFADIAVQALEGTLPLRLDEVDVIARLAIGMGPIRALLDDLGDPDVDERVIAAIRDAIEERVEDGEVPLRAATWLVTARRR